MNRNIDSNKAQKLNDNQKNAAISAEKKTVSVETPAASVKDGQDIEEAEKQNQPDSEASKADMNEPDIINPYNFLELKPPTTICRAMENACQTEPLAQYSNFSATCNPWEIYDAYTEELKKEEQREKQKATQEQKNDDKIENKTVMAETQLQTADLTKEAKAAKAANRPEEMAQDPIYEKFKNFEDPADKDRGQMGTLLPLWKFDYDKAKDLTVTALCWNSKNQELFGVGMGSYNFGRWGKGMLLFYILKDSSCPDRIYPTTSAVQCFEIHPQLPHLVAVGFYNGSVAVYNLKKRGNKPVYQSTANTGKHTYPVWQVRWQNDDVDGNHNFCSVSSDSRVVCWTLAQSELIFTDIIKPSVNRPGSGQLHSFIRGESFDFHKQIDDLFLVGTAEGKILKCSKTNSNMFLETYNAHFLAVNAVKWNHLDPNLFISCSFDGTVRIWNHTISTPWLVIDLKTPVGDVAWAPYSPTVFAAVTTDGKVHVFDLNVNKSEAICQQQVVSKEAKLTHIEFNPIHPVIIVGDDQGQVTCLKLSPNLRVKPVIKNVKITRAY